VARILIAALGVGSQGGWRHLEGFLPALEHRAGEHRFDLMCQASAVSEIGVGAGGSIEILPVADRIARSIVPRLFYDLCVIPFRARRGGYELVVTLANFGPVWCPVPHLVVQQNAMQFSREFLGRIEGLSRLEWRLRGLLCAAEMRFSTLNVSPTTALTNLIRSAHPSLAKRRFRTLFHGIDLSRFTPREAGAASRTGPFVFLCPTRSEVYKGLDILLHATRLLAVQNHDFEVHVTTEDRGWSGDQQRAIEKARGEAFFGHVRFVGAQPPARMPDLYRGADAVVFPSLCESFGFPLVEAMACGVPVVAGDTEVNRELCQDAARYYEAKSSIACAEAMKQVLEERACRADLQAKAAARIDGRDWSWDRNAARFVDLCESAIEIARG